MTQPAPTYTGRCLCEGIRYAVDRFGSQVGHCHCSMCRRFHGAAFATIADVPHDAFHWLQGEELLASYTASNGTTRQFCSRCGSSLTFAPAADSGKVVELAIGTLDGPGPQPDAHLFVDSASSWYDISDALPQYGGGRSSKRLK